MNLEREVTPPEEIRAAVIRQLRAEGLLRKSRMPWAIAAVMALAIATAVLVHRTPPRARYMLLLYEAADGHSGSREEYKAWARQMRPQVIGGEELDHRTLLTLNAPASPRVAGYFLIDASDDGTAARIARACPHVRHGGGVVLRRIVL